MEQPPDLAGAELAPLAPAKAASASLRYRLATSTGANYRWVVWAALGVINFNQNAQMYMLGIIVPYLLAELQLSYALAGTLVSAYLLSIALVITPVGILGDRLGGRRVLIVGTATMIAGSFLFAVADSFSVAFVSRIITGLGATAAITMSGPLAAYWFSVRQFRVVHGLGTGVGKVGSVAAMWVVPPLVVVIGWRLGFGVVSLAGPLALAAAVLVLASKPADVGLPPVDVLAGPARQQRDGERRLGLWQLLRRPSVAPLAVASFFYFAAYFGSINWLPSYLAEVLKLDKVGAGFQSGIVLWGTIAGYLLTGPAANRLGRCRPLYTGGFFLAGILITSLALDVSGLPGWVLPPFFFVLGIACSGLLFMTPMLAVLVPRGSLATASGLVFTTSYLGAVVMPPLMGLVADTTGSLAQGFWLTAACGFLGAVASLFIHEPAYPTAPEA
ncbi:MAG: MFS transporter [Chloroflexota bacterium]